ncbi:Breast carcinoma amplified sequence 3 [Physocladia obscura]|uniref:Breast carcinoma amplified sequence 3 n=1 Tax=Physocladia obscura TaxID=109957 RepID=A0AAD5TFV4_9FUNG|nr:Breast carcinoma amplified sequence 3 [Physocladia obscura]
MAKRKKSKQHSRGLVVNHTGAASESEDTGEQSRSGEENAFFAPRTIRNYNLSRGNSFAALTQAKSTRAAKAAATAAATTTDDESESDIEPRDDRSDVEDANPEEGLFVLDVVPSNQQQQQLQHGVKQIPHTTKQAIMTNPSRKPLDTFDIIEQNRNNAGLNVEIENNSFSFSGTVRKPTSTQRRLARFKPITQQSILSQIGSLVKGTISSSLNHVSTSLPLQNLSSPALGSQDAVVFAKFVNFGWSNDTSFANNSNDDLCLLLGYENGFQIWAISSSNSPEVSQLVSVRQNLGRIIDADIVPYPTSEIQGDSKSAELTGIMPLIVMIESTFDIDEPTSKDYEFVAETTSSVKLYSLKCHKIIKRMNFAEQVLSVKASAALIVVALSNNTLNVYSALNLALIETISDAYPVFAVGSRLLAYASTSRAPKPTKSTDSDISGDEFEEVHHTTEHISATDKAMDGIKKATNKVVKEVLSGANFLGNVGYSAVSNYLHPGIGNGGSVASVARPDGTQKRENVSEGSVAIKDYSFDSHFPEKRNIITKSNEQSSASILISHWKPHNNKLSNLTFNQPQTLLFTASTSANTFLIFSIQMRSQIFNQRRYGTTLIPQHCLFKLERGYTPATVETVAFSENGKWCAVSTARGTTHIYPIPYTSRQLAIVPNHQRQSGGAGNNNTSVGYEIGILNGWNDEKAGAAEYINNAIRGLTAGSVGSGILYPAARIKQSLAFGNESNEDVLESGSGAGGGAGGVINRAALCVGFLFERIVGTKGVLKKLHNGPNSGNIGLSGSSRLSGSPSRTGIMSGSDDFVRLFRQRVVSMHPLGFMTLHNIDVDVYLPENNGLIVDGGLGFGLGVSPKSSKPSSGPSPREGSLWLSVQQPQQQQIGSFRASVKDILQFEVKRGSDWQEFKPVLDMVNDKPSAWKTGNWATQIETTTYDTVSFGAPIWLDSAFKMNVFEPTDSTSGVKSDDTRPDLSDIPLYTKLKVQREASTPGRIRQQQAPSIADSYIANDLSSAMIDELSIKENLVTPLWKIDGVSFEDADIVAEENDSGQATGLTENSVHLGYFNKIVRKFDE